MQNKTKNVEAIWPKYVYWPKNILILFIDEIKVFNHNLPQEPHQDLHYFRVKLCKSIFFKKFIIFFLKLQFGEAKLSPFLYIEGLNFASPHCIVFVREYWFILSGFGASVGLFIYKILNRSNRYTALKWKSLFYFKGEFS